MRRFRCVLFVAALALPEGVLAQRGGEPGSAAQASDLAEQELSGSPSGGTADFNPELVGATHRTGDWPNFEIRYYHRLKEVRIYGRSDKENLATAVLFTKYPSGEVWLRVELASGGAASGDTLTKEFLYLAPWESPPPPPPPDPPDTEGGDGSFSLPPPPPPTPLVYEIFFFGSSEADAFENLTNIHSFAHGYDGDDTLTGGGAADELHGDAGNDVLRGGGGDDVLYGANGNDVLYGEDGDDFLEVKTFNSNDDANNNTLCGGPGADVLEGASNGFNQLDGELAGGVSDGAVDILNEQTTSYGSGFTEFEFTPGQDIIQYLGEVQDPDEVGYPYPSFIECG